MKLEKTIFIGYYTRDDEWGKMGSTSKSKKIKSKQNEWKCMKRNQARSSSGGVVRQFLASAGSSVLEAGKEAAKEVAISGARSALGV